MCCPAWAAWATRTTTATAEPTAAEQRRARRPAFSAAQHYHWGGDHRPGAGAGIAAAVAQRQPHHSIYLKPCGAQRGSSNDNAERRAAPRAAGRAQPPPPPPRPQQPRLCFIVFCSCIMDGFVCYLYCSLLSKFWIQNSLYLRTRGYLESNNYMVRKRRGSAFEWYKFRRLAVFWFRCRWCLHLLLYKVYIIFIKMHLFRYFLHAYINVIYHLYIIYINVIYCLQNTCRCQLFSQVLIKM